MALAIGCLLGGCGDPVLVTVGVTSKGTTASDGSDGPKGEGEPVGREDAGAVPGPDGGAGGDGPDEPSTPEDCLTLIDQSSQQGQATDGGVIQGRTVQLLGCKAVDDKDPAESSIWSRKDGDVLLEQGRRYSFRWPGGITLVSRVRLFGGSTPCSVDKVYEKAPANIGYLPSPGCVEFTSEHDVRYLRLTHEYGNFDWLSAFIVPFQLCKNPCPKP